MTAVKAFLSMAGQCDKQPATLGLLPATSA